MITNRRGLILQAFGLLTIIVSLSSANNKDETPINVSSFCENKQIKLKSISQVRSLINQVRKERPESCDAYASSLSSLGPILDVVDGGQTCNLELVNKLRNYHLQFINEVTRVNPNDKIPQSLRLFFISLCFQISAECKMTLINSLEYDTKDKLKEDDYKTIDMLEKYGATFLDSNTKISDFDDILLLSDVNYAVGGMDEAAKETKLMVKVKTNLLFKNLVKTCTNKFKPFYEKLILPLIVLSNLGYNYQGELLSRELKELKDSDFIRRWYNIVQTCEAFGAIEIFEDTETVLDDQQAITLISKEEADNLRSKQINKSTEADKNSEAIVYEPQPSHNGDELWIQDQKELESLVNKYKANASESSRIRKRLMGKMFQKLRDSMKSGKFGVFVSGVVGGMAKSKQDKKTNINEDMVSMMDDVILSNEATTSVSAIDTPVAYKGKVPPRRPGRHGYIPPKVEVIPDAEDNSKLSTKLFNRTLGKFLPNRWDLTMWFVGIIGVLLIILGCVILG